jgi:WD40 repeat protein
MRPSQATSPLAALAAALVPFLEPGMSETQRLGEMGRLEELLRAGRLPDVVERCLAHVGGERLVLVVDQFEELYALPAETQRRFVDVLTEAVEPRPDGRTASLTAVLTLRADFLGHSLQQAGLAAAMRDATLVIGQMTRDQLREAIVGPPGDEVTFEPGLVDRILDDVGDDAGNLPLLEFALTLLWDRQVDRTLTHAAYDELGGVDGAVARYAEEVYSQDLSPGERDAARGLLVQLVAPGEATGKVRRIARSSELDDTRWHLAQRLATTRLLVAGRDATGVETVELVHEALIPGWARLRDWVEADQEFRAWQERLRDNVQAWHDSGEDDGALLRGVPLAEAERWSKQRPDDLGPEERRFIATSRGLQGRSLRRLRAVAGGLTLLLVASLVLGVLALRESQRADRQARLAVSRFLVDQSEEAETTRPELSVHLSVAAYEIAETGETHDQLVRTASRHRDVTSLLASGTAESTALAFHPRDESLLFAVDAAGTLSVWDRPRGRPLDAVEVGDVEALAMSQDGDLLAAAGRGTVQLWDTSTRAPRKGERLEDAPSETLGLTFSPDGRHLAACGGQEVVLWDLAESGDPRLLPAGSEGLSFCSVGFSADGRLLRYPDGGAVRTWDTTRGEPVGEAALPQAVLPPPSDPESVGFGPDAEPLFITAFVASPLGGTVFVSTNYSELLLWDLDEGSVQRVPVFDLVTHVAFSTDGSWLAVATEGFARIPYEVTLLDLTNMTLARHMGGHTITLTALAVAGDGGVAAGGVGDAIAFYAPESGSQPIGPFSDAVLEQDGTRVVVASYETGAREWVPGESTRLADLPPSTRPGEPGAVLSDDARVLAVAAVDWETGRVGTVSVRAVDDAREVLSVAGPTSSFDLSPDGALLAVVSAHEGSVEDAEPEVRSLDLWSTESRQLVGSEPLSGNSAYASFSPDGRRLALAVEGSAEYVVIWDVEELQELQRFEFGDLWGPPRFSADGHRLALASSSGYEIRDVDTQERVSSLHHEFPLDGAFSSDGRRFATSADDGVVVWEVSTGRRLATLSGSRRDLPAGSHPSIAFGADPDVILTLGSGGLVTHRLDSAWAHQRLCEVRARDLTSQEWTRILPEYEIRSICTRAD